VVNDFTLLSTISSLGIATAELSMDSLDIRIDLQQVIPAGKSKENSYNPYSYGVSSAPTSRANSFVTLASS